MHPNLYIIRGFTVTCLMGTLQLQIIEQTLERLGTAFLTRGFYYKNHLTYILKYVTRIRTINHQG